MASDPGEDADRRDRLDAARDLSRDLRRGKKDPPRARGRPTFAASPRSSPGPCPPTPRSW
ncbi:MAG: hypothetical protein IPN01_10930 [Deltaproteobacteria bacterium]|nr:hypothetical protein [Deltaproteobacteria bacterium]